MATRKPRPSATFSLSCARMFLEQLRADLFRAEQLFETQPLPEPHIRADLPQDIRVLLDTLNATRTCLEEWMESQTCQAILATYSPPPTGEEPS